MHPVTSYEAFEVAKPPPSSSAPKAVREHGHRCGDRTFTRLRIAFLVVLLVALRPPLSAQAGVLDSGATIVSVGLGSVPRAIIIDKIKEMTENCGEEDCHADCPHWTPNNHCDDGIDAGDVLIVAFLVGVVVLVVRRH